MDEERTLKQIEADIRNREKRIAEINEEEKKLQGKRKPQELSNSKALLRAQYERELEAFKKERDNFGKPPVVADPPKTSNAGGDNINKKDNSGGGDTKSLEESLTDAEKRAQEAADQLNNEELNKKKLEDTSSALEQTRNEADQVDAATEENVPHWFWREAQEMAPTDKTKRGFIIANHVLNRLGTTLGNIGAIVQNAGGSGGAKLREHGGSFIDQYRQSKLEQVLANRKTKQDTKMQAQIDAFTAINIPENEMKAIQRRLRNSSFWNKYERLSNEQQVYLQGLLYNDTEGNISDAMLGNIIDQIMEGKAVSLEQVAVNALTAAGIDNLDEITAGAQDVWSKVRKYLNWDKPGE